MNARSIEFFHGEKSNVMELAHTCVILYAVVPSKSGREARCVSVSGASAGCWFRFLAQASFRSSAKNAAIGRNIQRQVQGCAAQKGAELEYALGRNNLTGSNQQSGFQQREPASAHDAAEAGAARCA
jgi:hypothetical protein